MSRRLPPLRRHLAALAAAPLLLCAAPSAANTCSGLQLAQLTLTNVGTTPVAVATADFNRDGRVDVVAANSGSNSVSVLLRNGDGTFTEEPGSPFDVGGSPVDIAAGDLDRDGYPDLVVGFSGQLKVVRRQPGGGFDTAATPFVSGAAVSRVYLADLTRDGRLDLLVVSNAAHQIRAWEGAGLTFPNTLPTIDEAAPGPPEGPSALATADFNRDGSLDIGVAFETSSSVSLYFGNGQPSGSFGWTAGPGPTLVSVTGPRDIAAGDVDRDGWPDLVTANIVSGNLSVLRNSNATLLMQAVTALPAGVPRRVLLTDLNLDGFLDVAALDDSATPRITAYPGTSTAPWFDSAGTGATLPASAAVRGLAAAHLTSDGRVDLVTALSGPRQVAVVQNTSGTPCVGTSFSRAPRGYPSGDGPVSAAAADFDGDGRTDLVVATDVGRKVRMLRSVNGHLVDLMSGVDLSPAVPAAVAAADFNGDGIPDVAVATSGPDEVKVFLGNGAGGLIAPAADSEVVGATPSALIAADFDGDGIPDLAATSQGANQVYVYLGDGLGGLSPVTPTAVGAMPLGLVAGHFDADTRLDLAVTNGGDSNVTILLGNGNGTFTPAPGSPVTVGSVPWGIAAGYVDADANLDLVTVNSGSLTVSVLTNLGGASFGVSATHTVPGPNPTGVALIELTGDARPELAVTSRGKQSVTVFTNASGTFTTPIDYALRNSPRGITPLDLDGDGRLDLAVPCHAADSVAVLLSRLSPPRVLLEAPRVDVGLEPQTVVVADLDRDGDLDLAVAGLDDRVTLLQNDGNGAFTPFLTPSYAVGADPTSVVAADFNRDGRLDLALNAPGPGAGTPSVSLLFGTGGGAFAVQPSVALVAGVTPDELAVGDFDRDGDIDIAVCNKVAAGEVIILRNDGSGGFTVGATIAGVGNVPTGIVAVDVDGDGDLDLAVANDNSDDVRILLNNGTGGFSLGALLPLAAPDVSPLSITAADFDGDGKPELAAAAFGGDRIHVYRNLGSGTFGAALPMASPAFLQAVTAADLNLDGVPDLVAVAAGLVAFRGQGASLNFAPQEVWLGGLMPAAAAIGDFNRDGRPDAAIVNANSNDVSVLLSTTCLARRLEVTTQPLACETGAAPYFPSVVVEARDDGGNLAVCATGAVKPSIAPGTGEPGAVLGPGSLVTNGLGLVNGVASFTAPNVLSIDRAGRRYRLRFDLEDTPPPNLPPALSRSFTLGPGTVQITGPASFCAPGSGLYQTLDPPNQWDSYTWKLDGNPVSFAPTALLVNPAVPPDPPVSVGSHLLVLTTRLDSCSVTATPFSLEVGDLSAVVLGPVVGVSTVCVDCIGGSSKAVTTGGGALAYQWGYRTVSGTGAVTPIAGETGDTYVLKGASFPGPGTYYVLATVTPTCGTTLESGEWMVTIVDGVPNGEVRSLAASSRGTPASGQNRLLWVNTAAPDEIRIRWNRAPLGTNNCVPPVSLTLPANAPPTTDEAPPILAPTPNATDSFLHSNLSNNTAYCYSVFVRMGALWSPGRTIKARPFDSTAGSVKWAYATGGTAVAPATVSSVGILAMSNDRTVHALTRGSGGGEWPSTFVPTELAGVAHSRSPVVPFPAPLNGAGNVLFVADDSPSGVLHAINAETGQPVWPDQNQGNPVTAAPGGMFLQFGGIDSLLFLGTRVLGAANEFRAVNATTGALVQAYNGAGSPGEIGPINGMPAIDYATRRVYFASWKRGAGDTLFCLEILAGGPPAFLYKWSRDLGDISTSPVLRGGRVYVGTNAGVIYSVNADTGGMPVNDDRSYTPSPADGPVKGFLFPDRRNDDLIFATDTKVWSLSDDADPMTKNWEWSPPTTPKNPSIVLYRPQTSFVYVGSANGELYELDFSGGSPTHKLRVLGGGFGQVGAPSLDIGVAPALLVVGSEPGVLYGLDVPFVP